MISKNLLRPNYIFMHRSRNVNQKQVPKHHKKCSNTPSALQLVNMTTLMLQKLSTCFSHGKYCVISELCLLHFGNFISLLFIAYFHWHHVKEVCISLLLFISLLVVAITLVTSCRDVFWLGAQQEVNREVRTDGWPKKRSLNKNKEKESRLLPKAF